MSFTDHIAKLKKAHAETINSMRKLSGSSWGPSARDLRGVYIAFSRSKLEYAAAAWAPRLTATQKNKIEVHAE